MAFVDILLDEGLVDEFLERHKLEIGFIPLETALLQLHGTSGGQPSVMLVGEYQGKKLLFKLTLNHLETIAGAVRGRVQYLADQVAQGNEGEKH